MSQANTQSFGREVVKVSRNDLPLSCPRTSEAVASMHPKVFLPIGKNGSAVCPYCGAHYQLTD